MGRGWGPWVIRTVWLASLLPVASADTIVLKNGAVLQGTWLNANDPAATEWQLQTDDGLKLTVARGDVKGTLRPPPEMATYAVNLAKVPDDLETQRRIVDWCLNNKLPMLVEAHRERIVELDPNDKSAWAALGYVRTAEGWTPKELYQRQRGLVLHAGRWYIPQDLAVIEANEDASQRKAELNKRIVRAITDLRTKSAKAAEASQFLRELRDPLAVGRLHELLKKDRSQPNPEFRRFLVEVIANIPCAESVSVLVETVLVDRDDSLRDECIEILQNLGRETAVQAFLARLVNRSPDKDDPTIYDRAGLALASLGDERCLPRLIDCLVTKHLRAPPPQPGYNVGQTSDGNVGFSQGQKKPVEVRVQNQGVLTALTTISDGQPFGFDTERWRQWYAETYAASNPYVLRDP
jgi:hypothetical protein